MIKEIPISINHYLDENGNCYDENMVIKKKYINGDGYITTSILNKNGKYRTYGLHRLLLLTFKPIVNDKLYQVNHIDGDITNNNLDNLEWCTAKENNIHRSLVLSDSKRNLLKCTNNDSTLYFNNLEDSSNHFKCKPKEIWFHIKNSTKLNGWSIEYCYNTLSVYNNDLIKRESRKKRKICVVNIYTYGIITFQSMNCAAKFFNTTLQTIRVYMSVIGNYRLFKDKYIISDFDKKITYLSDIEIKELLFKHNQSKPKEVLLYNTKTDSFKSYKSASLMLKDNPDLSKKAITTRLKKRSLLPYLEYKTIYVKNIDKDMELLRNG